MIRRCKGYMQRAGLEVAVPYGANPDLNDPLTSALSLLGITPSSRRLLVDADLSTLTGNGVEAYLDVAEVCVLRSLWGQLYQVDTTVGPRSESLSHLRRDLQTRLKERTTEVQRQWGDYLVLPIDATSGGIAKIRAL